MFEHLHRLPITPDKRWSVEPALSLVVEAWDILRAVSYGTDAVLHTIIIPAAGRFEEDYWGTIAPHGTTRFFRLNV
jgi:hypothetical protein